MSHAKVSLGFSLIGIMYPAPRSFNSTFLTSADWAVAPTWPIHGENYRMCAQFSTLR